MQFSAREIIHSSWVLFKANWGRLWLVLITVIAVEGVVRAVTSAAAKQQGTIAVFFLLSLAGLLVSALLRIGLIQTTLATADGGKPSVKSLFLGYKLLIRYCLASIVYGAIVFVGFLLLIVPGVYWSLKYGQYRMLIVDKNLGIFESLKESGRITEGYKMKILVVSFALAGLMILSIVPTIVSVILFGQLATSAGAEVALFVTLIPFIIGLCLLVFLGAMLLLVPTATLVPAVLYRRLLALQGGAAAGTEVGNRQEAQTTVAPPEEQQVFVPLGKEQVPQA